MDLRAAHALSASLGADASLRSSRSNERILVVDDDPCVTRAIRLNLCSRYAVVTANSGYDAIREMECDGSFAVIITDLRMPGMDGIALLEHVRKIQPDTVRIMLSGTVDVASTVRAVNSGGIQRLLLKPTSADDLERTLDTAIAEYRHCLADRALAFEDPLLEIGTRRAFDQAAQRVFAHSLRYGRPLCVVMIDVDHFKQYNDSFGHLAGDDALRRVAHAIRDTLRASDQPFRFGGEEFVLLLPDTSEQGAMTAMERCRLSVCGLEIVHPSSAMHKLTVSLGAAVLEPKVAIGIAQLVDRADQALYLAKRSGRNCSQVWSSNLMLTTDQAPQ